MMSGEKLQIVALSEPTPVHEIAKLISEFRKEFYDGLVSGVIDEADEVADSGYDPARGRGRGPWWADGG